jgi:hypothetical protein
VTFKDLQKIIQINQQQNNQQFSKILEDCKDIPFWINDKDLHKQINKIKGRKCCWNHYISLCKDNHDSTKENPIFDYQQEIVDILKDHKHLFILKSTGLGISELFLRYMAFLCLRNN